jgi:hypothetical protein
MKSQIAQTMKGPIEYTLNGHGPVLLVCHGTKAFYGTLHGLFWGMLRLFSMLSPRRTALQTLASFSTHDPKDTMSRLLSQDIRTLCHFFHGHFSREGALIK